MFPTQPLKLSAQTSFLHTPPAFQTTTSSPPLTQRVPEIAVTFRPTIAEHFTASLHHTKHVDTLSRHTHTHTDFKLSEF
jgi:hypothetical protein